MDYKQICNKMEDKNIKNSIREIEKNMDKYSNFLSNILNLNGKYF